MRAASPSPGGYVLWASASVNAAGPLAVQTCAVFRCARDPAAASPPLVCAAAYDATAAFAALSLNASGFTRGAEVVGMAASGAAQPLPRGAVALAGDGPTTATGRAALALAAGADGGGAHPPLFAAVLEALVDMTGAPGGVT